jgi:hypothetical protein
MNYVAVCTPARDMVHTNFTYCLVNMVAYHTINTTDAVSLKIMQGTLIQNQRADLALDAMAEGCTHILFIDADMRFPKDAIFRLLQRDEAIVAANYSTRKLPLQPVAFRDDTTTERVYTEQDDTGLESVAAIGMGLMLIKAEVFQKMPKPWFHIHYQNGVYSGEDIWFCRSARESGFEVMLDHDISHQVRHIGGFEFSCAHAAASRGE